MYIYYHSSFQKKQPHDNRPEIPTKITLLTPHQTAQAAAVCLGHMATPLWRGPLQTALPSIEQLWMKAGESKD